MATSLPLFAPAPMHNRAGCLDGNCPCAFLEVRLPVHSLYASTGLASNTCAAQVHGRGHCAEPGTLSSPSAAKRSLGLAGVNTSGRAFSLHGTEMNVKEFEELLLIQGLQWRVAAVWARCISVGAAGTRGH